MNETTREWKEKAEGDYLVAGRELSAEDRPNFDAVCFHSQQCIEKLFKAALLSIGMIPPRIHDLGLLSSMLSEADTSWTWSADELRFLSVCSVAYRYPGDSADRDDAERALSICNAVKGKLLRLIEAGKQG
jgi:HEPN domain-containing protein